MLILGHSVVLQFARNKVQYTDSQISADGQHKLDTLPMLPSITCTAAQGAHSPTPCNPQDRDACDRAKNPTGLPSAGHDGCCIDCGDLATIKPVTGLSLDLIMIENYSPSMDAHAKSDGHALREGVRALWLSPICCQLAPNPLASLIPSDFSRRFHGSPWSTAMVATSWRNI